MDLFLFPNSYCDVASMADVVRLTSGNLYKYSYFQVIIFCYWKQNKEKKCQKHKQNARLFFKKLVGWKGWIKIKFKRRDNVVVDDPYLMNENGRYNFFDVWSLIIFRLTLMVIDL